MCVNQDVRFSYMFHTFFVQFLVLDVLTQRCDKASPLLFQALECNWRGLVLKRKHTLKKKKSCILSCAVSLNCRSTGWETVLDSSFLVVVAFLTRITPTILCHKSSGSELSRTSLVERALRMRSVLELSCVLHTLCVLICCDRTTATDSFFRGVMTPTLGLH